MIGINAPGDLADALGSEAQKAYKNLTMKGKKFFRTLAITLQDYARPQCHTCLASDCAVVRGKIDRTVCIPATCPQSLVSCINLVRYGCFQDVFFYGRLNA